MEQRLKHSSPASEPLATELEHCFRWTAVLASLDLLLKEACRKPFLREVIAHDPTMVPALSIVSVRCTDIADRDRVRVALRFYEQASK